jgi:hypothetical protein
MDKDVDRLVKEGHALTAPEAAALERRLEEQATDLDARARLLGYYAKCCKQELGAHPGWLQNPTAAPLPACAGRFRHALWVIAQAPGAALAAHPVTHIPRTHQAYFEAARIWQQNVDGDPVNATVLDHALRFFERQNHVRVEELLERAERAYPDDVRWARRRRSIRADELGAAWLKYYGADLRGGETPVVPELVEIEALLREGELEPPAAAQLHDQAARILLHFGHLARAREHAHAMVATATGILDGQDGPQVHSGHVLLGTIALREGDVEEAKARLELAGTTAGSSGLYPKMALARELLAHDERDAVLQYLRLCRAARESLPAVLDRWIAELRDGLIPELRFPFALTD